MTGFVDFFNTDETLGSRLSEAALRANWATAIKGASHAVAVSRADTVVKLIVRAAG